MGQPAAKFRLDPDGNRIGIAQDKGK